MTSASRLAAAFHRPVPDLFDPNHMLMVPGGRPPGLRMGNVGVQPHAAQAWVYGRCTVFFDGERAVSGPSSVPKGYDDEDAQPEVLSQ